MVFSRFTSFLFGLSVFISLNSFAYSHQADVEKQMVAAANALVLAGGSPLSLQKEIFPFPTPAEARNEEIVGRKMMKMKLVLKNEMLKVNVETASLKVSNNHKGKTTSKQTMIGTGTSHRHRGHHHHHHIKVVRRLGSFVALNADYHVPKSHPPKNN